MPFSVRFAARAGIQVGGGRAAGATRGVRAKGSVRAKALSVTVVVGEVEAACHTRARARHAARFMPWRVTTAQVLCAQTRCKRQQVFSGSMLPRDAPGDAVRCLQQAGSWRGSGQRNAIP